MPKLSNDILREKSIKEFLTAMGVDTSKIEITSVEGLFSFSSTSPQHAEQFAVQLNEIIKDDQTTNTIKSISIAQIINSEIEKGTCRDEAMAKVHRIALKGLLEAIKAQATNFKFSQETGEFEVTLPGAAYAAMFNQLAYQHLKFTAEGKLLLNIKSFLSNHAESIIKLEGLNPQQFPLVVLNAAALETKKMFFSTKTLADGALEVTPYFFVPKPATAPEYRFVIDTSYSMDEKGKNDRSALFNLQRSICALTKQLFAFQPNARISLTTFSTDIVNLGTFTAADYYTMERVVLGLMTNGTTALYNVTRQMLEKSSTPAQHNNILLFTDGCDTASGLDAPEALDKQLAALSDLAKARTKFFVFSYNQQQHDLMYRVASTFQSQVVDTDDADFVAALHNEALLKQWAAAKELFSAQIVVELTTGKTETATYKLPLDMSGQLAALKPRISKPGEKITITVTDGSAKQVVQNSVVVKDPKQSPSMVKLINAMGLNAVSAKNGAPAASATHSSYSV